MSRSYKKTPGYCDRNPFMKNYANRRLRGIQVDTTIPDGKAYKKYTCSYDICDWTWLMYTEAEYRRYVERAHSENSIWFETSWWKYKSK